MFIFRFDPLSKSYHCYYLFAGSSFALVVGALVEDTWQRRKFLANARVVAVSVDMVSKLHVTFVCLVSPG